MRCCLALVVVLLLSCTAFAAQEEAAEAQYEASVAQEYAECGRMCAGDVHDAGNAEKTAYLGKSQTHLTNGEQALVAGSVSSATACLAEGWVHDVFGMVDEDEGDIDRSAGDVAYAAELWNTAEGKYTQAVFHYNAAIVHYFAAEDAYIGYIDGYGLASTTIDNALTSSDCLACSLPDAECECP